MDLNDSQSRSIVYWLLNKLGQVQNSDDSLMFSNGLICEFLVIETEKPRGQPKCMLSDRFRSKNSKNVFQNIRKTNVNFQFCQLIKDGLVDMKLLVENTLANCLNLSIFFGLASEQFAFHVPQTLNYILKKYKTVEKFEDEHILLYKLFLKDSSKTLSNLYYISKLIKRPIHIFTRTKNSYFKFESATNNFKNSFPIKLLWEDDHIQYIFDNYNLERKGYVYCSFCRKSFQNIKLHRCIKEKCVNCFLYLSKIRNSKCIQICKSDKIRDINENCPHCNKKLTNQLCKDRHIRLSKSECQRIKYCSKCDKNYFSRDEHRCNVFFCKKCLKFHEESLFCRTSFSFKKRKQQVAYFCEIQTNKEQVCVFLAQFSNDQIITIYHFESEKPSYIEYQLDCYKNTLLKKIYHNLQSNTDCSIPDIIMILEISNQRPKFLMQSESFNFILDNLNLDSCKLETKENNPYLIKAKQFSVIKIEQYLQQFNPVHLCKKLNTKICPLYIMKCQ